MYAEVLARDNVGILTYINLGVEKMIQGSARVLQAAVMTIDYGSSWNGSGATTGRSISAHMVRRTGRRAQANVIENDSIDNVQTRTPTTGPR